MTKLDLNKFNLNEMNLSSLNMEELNEKLSTLYSAMNMRSNRIAKAALHEVVPTFKEANQVNGGGVK